MKTNTVFFKQLEALQCNKNIPFEGNFLTHAMMGHSSSEKNNQHVKAAYSNLRIRMLTKNKYDIERWLSGATRILAEQTNEMKIIHSVLMMMTLMALNSTDFQFIWILIAQESMRFMKNEWT